YLVKIFTKQLKTEFKIHSEKELNTAEETHRPIIDFLGKNAIVWEPDSLQFNGTANGGEFYITYEEVKNGSGQHGIVREETETRV
ncbi:MAG: hypothetical protein ACPGRT_05340, partial [Flavobacteriaceae bacterium]